MTPNHANKKGVRYRYYISQKDKERLKLPVWRIPAGDLESLIAVQLFKRNGIELAGQMPTKEVLRTYIEQITVRADQIEICFTHDDDPVIVPATWVRRGNERRLATDTGPSDIVRPDPALVKLVVRAHQSRQHLVQAGSVQGASQSMGLNQRYFAGLLRLSSLAPDITAAILDGRQPLRLNRQRLARITNLPLDWQAQRQLLGFA